MVTKIVYKNKYFQISKENNYFFFDEKNDQVVIFPIIDNKKVILVKQYRVPLKRNTFEFPAGGLINKNESTKKAAQRELFEETGVKINLKNLKKIHKVNSNPQRQKKFIHIFIANINKNCLSKRQKKISGEIKSIKIISIIKLLKMFRSRQIISGVMGYVFLIYLLLSKKYNNKFIYKQN